MDKLLIVEDDKGVSTQLKWGLSKSYKIKIARDRQEALKSMDKVKPAVVMLDLGLPPCENEVVEGMACLKDILSVSPRTKVIVVTGNDDREHALHAIGFGAYDFYQKPVDLEVLKVILQRAFHQASLEREYNKLREHLSGTDIFEGMLGGCAVMQEVFNSIKKVSSSDATILITGDSGTGKELVSRAIHRKSLRNEGPFVPINCGSIPETLIESELFGHEKGAFTDAKSRKIGMVEKASGGTLFLDEIGELPLQLQVKLLRFIQERKIQRVGGSEEIGVDLRIIVATNIDLDKAVKEGKFREDLFFRISVINIMLPRLKERGEDILIIARSFLSKYSHENHKNIKGFSREAIGALADYSWPGNVRELENKVQRAVIMTDTPMIELRDLSLPDFKAKLPEDTPLGTLKDVRTRAEIDAINKALLLHEGNISKAAETLEVSRPTLYDLINKYDLKTKVVNG